MKKHRGNMHSIKFNLTLISILLSIPIILFLLCTNIYSVKTAREKEADLIKSSLRVYQSQTDSAFESIEKYMVGVLERREDLLLLEGSKKDNNCILAKMRLQNNFMNILSVNEPLYGLFAYSMDNGNIAYYYSPGIKKEEREALNTMVIGLDERSIMPDWFACRAGDHCYFLRMIKFEGIWLGAVVKADDLIQAYKQTSGEASVDDFMYVSGGGQILTQSLLKKKRLDMGFIDRDYSFFHEDGSRYMLTGIFSAAGNFGLAAIAREKGLSSGFSLFQFLVIGIVLICLAIMKLQRCFFQKKIIDPVNITVSAMERVREGDLETHIEKQGIFDEFQVVHDTFNTMVADIRQLKIDVYEESLKHKQTMLQYLQLQMNPHFFVNTINVIQRMLELEQYEKASSVMDYLTEYMRYVLNCSRSVVTLHSELEHVDNYVEIQKVRFKSEMKLRKSINPYALFMSVPQMLLHTFVENAFKYAADRFGVIDVHILCDLEAEDGRQYLRIEINDSGPGYPENILKMLRGHSAVLDERGEHIGLYNIKNRLALLFGPDVRFSVENKDGHAWAMMKLPAVEIDDWENK